RAEAADRLAEREREPVRREVGGEEQDEEPGPSPDHGEHRSDDHEHEPVGRDAGEVDDERVQPIDAMVDDPALEVAIERDQVGSSCLVCVISSCGSNGLPMKPCAPRSAASPAACSSTLPLNITTGTEPTPCRSCISCSISQPSTFGIITSSS